MLYLLPEVAHLDLFLAEDSIATLHIYGAYSFV